MGFALKFIDRTGTSSTSVTSYTPNSSTTQGLFLVLIIGTGGSGHVTDVSDDTASNLWSLDVVGTNGTRNICIASSQLQNALTTSNTVWVGSSVDGASQTLLGFEYSLVDNRISDLVPGTPAYDRRSGAFANSSSGPLSTGSTGLLGSATDLAVTGIVSSTTETYTGPSGYTTRTSTANTSSGADKITTLNAALNPSWSWNNSANTAVGIATYFMAVAPTVTTTAASSIKATSVSTGGNVTDGGGNDVTARGVCYSATNSTPTTSDSTSSSGTGTGSYTVSLTGLNSGALYYYRAYATNGVGTSYDASVSTFTTATTGFLDIIE